MKYCSNFCLGNLQTNDTMIDRMTDEELFRQFRPYCAILTTQTNAECLEKLALLCDKTPAEDLEKLQEYLMFPAQLHLKTKTGSCSSNYTVSMLEFITNFYRRVTLSSFFIFKDILSSCLSLVSSSSPKPSNEDIQMSMCECIKQLLISSHDGHGGGVISEIMSQSNNMKLPLSHLIFTCLTWAEDNKVSTLHL